jgi:cell wall-associated NlpC family hydrolase
MLQRQQSGALDRSELAPGDLVFFTMGTPLRVDHVGIYVGDGHFVHAPRAGSPVRLSRIDDASYAARFAGGARYWQ